MSDLRNTITQFREAMSAEALQSPAPDLRALLARDRQTRVRQLGWGAGAALLLCAALAYWKPPQHTPQPRHEARDRADAVLMERVNQGLMRPVPRAMAPLMGLGAGAFGGREEEVR